MGRNEDKTNVDRLIDENLRRVYDSVLNDKVPDRFSSLLDRLRAGEVPDGADKADEQDS